ncbi:MAG: HAMP domain-containing sensor histidine kinase [bacterium]
MATLSAAGVMKEANGTASTSALARSQILIVNVYTFIAVVYCGVSSWLFYTVAGSPFLGAVHLFSLTVISANFLVLQVTRNYTWATHVILFIGTLVVGSLFGTSGWAGSGWLWTFAYLPYAFFLASTSVAQLWVSVLVVVDATIVILGKSGRIHTPYDDVGLLNFFAALGIFLLCMFLFKRAVLKSEQTNARQADELATSNAQLSARQADLAQAQQVARLGSWTFDPATGHSEWSEEMRRMFALPAGSQPRGLDGLLAFVHVDDRPRVQADLTATMTTGHPLDFEVRLLRADGVLRRAQINARSERNANGHVTRLLGTAQDVTEAREADEARQKAALQMQELESLKDVNRLKTQFMNTAAHELSTPLTPINLELRLLRDQLAQDGPEAGNRSLDVLQRNIDRLGLLVRDLLEGARLQSAAVGLKRARIDLASLAHDSVGALATTAKVAGVELKADATPGQAVDGDAKRLALVIDNLVGNAIKFTPAGGHVVVKVRRASGGVMLRVEDTGAGIREQDIARLFQPFSQVHDTTQQSRPGTGLGLYISKGIVEAHGGRIGVESPGPGKGTSFWFVLAASDAGAVVGSAPA